MDSEALRRWISDARKLKGWTQEQLGHELGLTKANISHWETGKHEPSFSQLLRIRDLTGHPLRDVLPAGDWPFPDIPREQLTSLTPEQRQALQAGIVGILAAIAPAPAASRGKPQPRAA